MALFFDRIRNYVNQLGVDTELFTVPIFLKSPYGFLEFMS